MSEYASPDALRTSPAPQAARTILASIGRAEAPVGVPGPVLPPASLPGDVGVSAALRSMVGAFRSGVAHAERMQQRHGEIYRSMYMTQPMVAVCGADEVQKILRNEQSVWSTAMAWEYLFFDGLNAEGGNPGSLLTLDFGDHSTVRRLMQPAFSASAIRGYLEIARPLVDRAIAGWITDGGVHLKPAMHALFPAISNRLLTGIEDPAELARIDEALRHTSSGAQALVRRRSLNPWLSRAKRAYGYLTDYFVPLVPARRAAPGSDLFSQLCQLSGVASDLTDHALVRVFLTMMLGAHDSTSLGITSMSYLLAKHIPWQRRLREEADQVGARALDAKGLQKLDQLEWVWKESLRLMPITDFLPRRALADVEIAGHKLEAGTLVGAMAGCLGRHPAWWTEPLKFDPERFSPERAEHKRHPAIFSPFGGGAHVCIGMQLATLQAKVFFHTLLTRCSFFLHKDYEAAHVYRPLGCVSGSVGLRLVAR